MNWAIILVLVVGLAACAAPPAAPAPAPGEPAAQPPAEAPAAPAVEAPAGAITLRYANWNLGTEEENNLQRQLVKAYMDMHPNVTIEFVDMAGEGRWDEKLTNYAARGALPDVFMADNTPLYVKNGWTADLSELVQNDPDWEDVPRVLKEAVTYNGKVLGLPAAHFIMGYFVNKDLFDAANLDAPEYGVSVDDFFAAVTAVTNVQRAVIGLSDVEPILGWYPSTQDSRLGWFSFDGEKMNYNSPAFRTAVAKAGEMLPYSWAGLTEEQKANFKSKESWEFLNEEFGVHWDGGWWIPGLMENAPFDWDFMGIPGGNQALVADIIVISSATPNLEAAYDFAKWMTFSKAAYVKEVELARTAGLVPTKMPVSVDAESIDLYFSFFEDKPGVRQAMENLDDSILESLAKIVPGYIQARWEGKPGIDIGEDKDVNMWYMFYHANSGKFKFEDYAPQLEEFANRILAEARAELPK
jgi:ABC-type glycerol-3-phosphate transport system substrate-binding protein